MEEAEKLYKIPSPKNYLTQNVVLMLWTNIALTHKLPSSVENPIEDGFVQCGLHYSLLETLLLLRHCKEVIIREAVCGRLSCVSGLF
jgi:hypothetical protein